MDSFIVSARKYRPVTFDSVVGQKSITNTLKNAIRNEHLAQAFLFTGPRGVGKTTCARILAKTINCENLSEKIEACDQCEPCKAFNESSAFNVHELDAASNNSVDDIRKLVDQVRIPPQIGKYKVYIIDEVHMLSQAAFNAFLKTLEEPPKYAKFILATTEKHKIIPTILSRCQIFDFARITVDDIAKHLLYVAENEGVEAEHNALHIIAQKADGALRDALSIFDQMVSFSGNHLTYKQVIENLNVLDYDYYFRITDMLLQGQSTEILLLINEIIYKGFEGSEFLGGFGEHLRNLLISQNPATVQLIEVSDDIREEYLKQAKACSPEFLLKALELNTQADLNYKESNNKRLTLELALLQMAALIKKKSPELIEEKPALVAPEENPKKPAATPIAEAPIPSFKAKGAEKPVTEPLPSFSEAQREEPEPTVPTQPIIEEKPAPPRQAYRPLSLKIHDAPEPEAEEEDLEAFEEDQPQDDISLNTFLEVWKTLAATFQGESQSLYVAMTNYEPSINPAGMIRLRVDNAIQENLVFEHKAELLGYLRKELNNYAIQLETNIVENQQQQKVYLPKEKLEKFIEKNPEIDRLRKDLDLDLIY
ncbi:MAG: DNA polymerase III subunit gamma/tau [Bacteroidales bacterium]|jgi:DNA polymerase-3 subunit gamma/tau|nr:DNA polymerase III subunit gamma/tau [Bacteroidales bacterium]NLM93705.1 DNA polymerase III subunit gamma/tau [Bacteroidales bacterium]